MARKYYLISFDKDLGGRKFYLKHREKTPHKNYAYGKNAYTTTASQAKVYHKLGNAVNMAKKICIELGFTKLVLVNEWTPQEILGDTKVVKTI